MKRKINRLTAKAVAHATRDLCDGYGLWLQYSPVYKTKAWLFRFMIDGKADSMGLGSLNTVSLAKARDKAQEARDLLREGINPPRGPRRRASPKEGRDRPRRSASSNAPKTHRAKGRLEKRQAHPQWATPSTGRGGTARLPGDDGLINNMQVEAIDTGLVPKVTRAALSADAETAAATGGVSRPCSITQRRANSAPAQNPARWKGHLDQLLPGAAETDPRSSRRVPYPEIPASWPIFA